MTVTALKASLALWRRRHTFRQKKLDVAHKRNDAKGVKKWHRLLAESGRMIHHREQQIAAKQPKTRVGWMHGVRHLPRSSAGGWQISCKPKGILHTTEGAGDATSTLDANGDHPHFQVERNGRITQYISVFEAAKALRHVGNPPTNGAHALQIEVCGFAAHPDWPEDQVHGVRQVMRFIEDNAGVQQASFVKFVTGGGARLGGGAWLATGGWMGHQHVPENDHVDPGPINIKELL